MERLWFSVAKNHKLNKNKWTNEFFDFNHHKHIIPPGKDVCFEK